MKVCILDAGAVGVFIGALVGCRIQQTPEQRHAIASKLGAFKSSVLQDLQAGRLIELDAIVGRCRKWGSALTCPLLTSMLCLV